MVQLSITQINLDWEDRYSYFNNNIFPKIIWVSILTINYLIGSVFMLAIVVHERFGEDPQKRSLVNQVKV